MRDAGSRFAVSTQPAGPQGRLRLGGTARRLASSASADGTGAPAARPFRLFALALAICGLASLLIAGSAGAGTIHELEKSFKLPGPGRPTSIAIDEEAELLYILNLGEGPHRGLVERFDLEGNPINYPGVPGFNESQNISFEGTWNFGDTFTVTCPNGDTTDAITFDSGEPQNISTGIKSALEAKCGGTFSVSGGTFSQNIHYEGIFAETNIPPTTCTKVTGSGTCFNQTIFEQDGSAGSNGFRPNCQGDFSCSQIAVDNSGGPNQGVIYVGVTAFFSPTVQVFLPDGTEVGPIGNFPGKAAGENFPAPPCGVAVDDEGNLYITHSGGGSFSFVDRYAPLDWASNPHQTTPGTGTIRPVDFDNPCRAAVDSNKSLLITSGQEVFSGAGNLHRIAPGSFGPPAEPFTPGTSTTIINGTREPAVDPSNNDVYTSNAGKIVRFDATDSPIEEFGAGQLTNEVPGLEVNGQTGAVYVADGIFGPNEVRIFKAVPVPDALTQDATAVGHSTATLHGHVDPAGAGEITGCEFQYVKDSLYNSSKFASATSVPCEPAAPFISPEDVHADLSSLQVEEGFHYRLRATNANGTSNGTIKAFMTRAVLDIKTENATDVAPRSATLNASFTGEGAPIEYFYEWGENAGYGNVTPTQTLPSPNGTTPAPQNLPGLELERLYHYRVVAVNSFGTSKGEDKTFTTLPAVTALQTKPATSLDIEDITLNAEFQGDGLDTKYFFEYGLTTEYESQTPEEDAGVTNGATPISAEIDQFNGFREYHYRVVAINSFGETVGADQVFVAPDALKPGIANTEPVSVTPTTANVASEINPNHWQTIYLFEWGETHSYGNATQFSQPVGGLDNEPIPVSAVLTGLTPGTTYYFRVVAANFRGTTEGEESSFITPEVPRVDATTSEAVTKTSAHLAGLVAPGGSPTKVIFQYGTTAAYGQSTPEVAIGEDLISHTVGADLSGLSPGTTYHFRIAATNAFGSTFGPDQAFTTAAEPTAKSSADCDKLSNKAKNLQDKAKGKRKKAKKAKGKRAKALRREAKSLSKQASKLNKEANACRSTSGGSGK